AVLTREIVRSSIDDLCPQRVHRHLQDVAASHEARFAAALYGQGVRLREVHRRLLPRGAQASRRRRGVQSRNAQRRYDPEEDQNDDHLHDRVATPIAKHTALRLRRGWLAGWKIPARGQMSSLWRRTEVPPVT